MAEIFGAVAAGFAVCHEMSRLAKSLRKIAKTIKNAPKNIETLTDETVMFTGLYMTFLQTCEDSPEICKGATSSIERLKIWAESTVRRLREILKEGDALRSDSEYRYPVRHTAKAHWKWLIRRKVVTSLRASLSIARQSIEGFSNLICIRKLNEELKILRDALADPRKRYTLEQQLGMSLESKIESINTRLEVRASVHLTNATLLDQARNEATVRQENSSISQIESVSDELLDLVDSFDQFAEDIVPSVSFETSSSPIRSAFGGKLSATQFDSTSSSVSDYPASEYSNLRFSVSNPSLAAIVIDQPAPAQYRARSYRASTQPSGLNTVTNMRRGNTTAGNQAISQVGNQVSLAVPSPPRPLRTSQILREDIIGRHNISLTATHFFLNDHSFNVNSYPIANKFFDDLLQCRDRVDALNQTLNNQVPGSEWFGIPGWKVHPGGITMQAESLGIRNA